MRRQSSHDASKSFTHPDATESPASFLKLPTELQNLIWEETFSQPRIFDDDTLRLINPQDGIAYSYLTPYALYVCRGSRTFAQSRLCRTFLFRTWPPNSRRTIYFNPNCDVCIYRFTDLSWRPDFIPGRCLFNYIEIIANVSPDRLTSTTSQGLRSVEFSIRNGWYEDEWSQKSRLRQGKWDLEWKTVQDFFERRNVTITISPTIPEKENSKKAFVGTFPAYLIPTSASQTLGKW